MRLLILDKPGDDLLLNYKLLIDKNVHPIYLTSGLNNCDEDFICNNKQLFKETEVHQLMKIIDKKENEYSILDFKDIDIARLNNIIKKFVLSYRIDEIFCSFDIIQKLIIENVKFYYYINSIEEEFCTDEVVKKFELTLLERKEKENLFRIYFSFFDNLKKNKLIYEEKYRLYKGGKTNDR